MTRIEKEIETLVLLVKNVKWYGPVENRDSSENSKNRIIYYTILYNSLHEYAQKNETGSERYLP